MQDERHLKAPTAPSAVALLAANVTRLRKHGRWSARAFSEHACVGRNTLASIEASESKTKGVELGTVDKLARALGVETSALFAVGKGRSKPWSGTRSVDVVGQAIQRARGERHMTQEELSLAAGVSREVLARIEVKAQVPTLATLERIANALGGSVEALLSSPQS